MSEERFTPDLDDIRDVWVDYHLNPLPRVIGIARVPEKQAEFDRAIAAHTKAALLDAADSLEYGNPAAQFLQDRADEL